MINSLLFSHESCTKKQLIKELQPPTDDWEHYADRLHDIAYKYGYEQAMAEQGLVLEKIREEIKRFMYEVNPSSSESDYACNYILDLLEKYREVDQ